MRKIREWVGYALQASCNALSYPIFFGCRFHLFFDEQVRVVELGSDSAKFFNGASPWGGHRNQ